MKLWRQFINVSHFITSNPDAQWTRRFQIKDSIIAFNNFWSETIDLSVVNTDKYTHLCKEETLDLIAKSVSQQITKQVDFGREYIPIKTAEERETYEHIWVKHQWYIEELYKVKAEVDEIRELHFPAAVVADRVNIATRKLGEIFQFTHKYIALLLADNVSLHSSSSALRCPPTELPFAAFFWKRQTLQMSYVARTFVSIFLDRKLIL